MAPGGGAGGMGRRGDDAAADRLRTRCRAWQRTLRRTEADIARQHIENQLQGDTRVCTAHNGRVRGLANGRQCLSHLPVKLAGQGVAMGEALGVNTVRAFIILLSVVRAFTRILLCFSRLL